MGRGTNGFDLRIGQSTIWRARCPAACWGLESLVTSVPTWASRSMWGLMVAGERHFPQTLPSANPDFVESVEQRVWSAYPGRAVIARFKSGRS